MLLDIKPFHIDIMNCYEAQVVTAVTWLKREYTLMFSEIWCFSYKELDEKNPLTVGDRISASSFNKWKLLEKYHGVRATSHDIQDTATVLGIIREQLAAGNPVILRMDSFWCPWHEHYLKGHDKFFYYCLAIGMEENNDTVLCTDSFNMKYAVPFPPEDFRKARPYCGTFAVLDDYETNYDWQSMICNALQRVSGKAELPNAFNAIRQFGKEIAVYFDEKLEIGDIRDYWETPLYLRLINVARSRQKFVTVLKYFIDNNNAAELSEYAESMETAAAKWAMIREMLAKGIVSANMKRMQGKISEQLLKLADFEEQIFNRMSDVYMK